MQTKKGSFFEVCCNMGSGFILAALTWNYVVVRLFDLGLDYHHIKNNLLITCIFTVVSLVRSFFWRRMFNWFEIKGIVK